MPVPSNAPASAPAQAEKGNGAFGKQMEAGLEVSSSATSSAKPEGGSDQENFGEVWKRIQSKYGAKPEKPREIKKTLGKDDFMRIMITQMRNQDPTQPFKAEQMAEQMAQFATVEQLSNMSQAMGRMANQNKPLERLAMTNMIGKSVTVDRGRFPHTEGTNENLAFALPADASQVRVSIVSDTGETILQKELGSLKAGDNSFNWDGKKANTTDSRTGGYAFAIEATDKSGAPLQVNMRATSRVTGVSFEGGEPVFLIGDVNSPEKVTMASIVRIDDGSAPGGFAPAIPGAQSLGAVSAAQAQGQAQSAPASTAPKGPNFFTFEPGKGSTSGIDNSRLTPEVQAALQQFEQQRAELAARGTESQAVAAGGAHAAGVPSSEEIGSAALAAQEKGFANGLSR